LIKNSKLKKILKSRKVDLKSGNFDVNYPDFLKRIYIGRGITNEEQLDYSLKKLHPPKELKGLDKSISLLEEVLNHQQRVLIVGDFDVDGATSTALMVLALSAMGTKNIDYIVPDRFKFGYGLTPEIVKLANKFKPDLLITVDNGISSISGVLAAKKAGMKVLITDHHLPGLNLPIADAILNPNQHGCDFPCKNLAGVGVVFYLLIAFRSRLRNIGWFERQKIMIPNMSQWLDLVALGTVADVVPLDYTNRILVHQGLLRIRSGHLRPGIQALLDLADKDHKKLIASDLGFAVGPRLNAAGRLTDMSIGIACLLENDNSAAKKYAIQLEQLNLERKSIEVNMREEGLEILEKININDIDLPWGICLFDSNWHQGVSGLLASRIKDHFHRPVIIFADALGQKEKKEYKGSARSIPGLHIRDTLEAVATTHPGIINKFGGHAMAAGLSLDPDKYLLFTKAFDKEVRSRITISDLEALILTDGVLSAEELCLKNALLIRDAGPWGQQFPEPLFVGDFYILSQRVIGKKHIKLVLCLDFDKQEQLSAIAFNVSSDDIEEYKKEKINIVYKVDVNFWQGRESLQLIIETLIR
jgi:single-stranded-DNA-specific exonuclease